MALPRALLPTACSVEALGFSVDEHVWDEHTAAVVVDDNIAVAADKEPVPRRRG